MRYPDSIKRTIDQLARLPGIGPKAAERIVFYLLKSEGDQAQQLSASLSTLKSSVKRCRVCGNLDTGDPCTICVDTKRDPAQVCVVAEAQDIPVIEKTGAFLGYYHVLGGVINPVEGITPDQLRIKPLVEKINQSGNRIKEVIIATNPDLEGESTALYLARQLKPLGVKVTRLAKGLPMGATIEYADEVTVSNALKGRQPL